MSLPNSQPGPFARLSEAFVFGNRPLILIVFALVTAAMTYFATQLSVDAGFKKQIPLKHEYMRTFVDYEADFGGANRVLIAVMAKDGNMFSQPFMGTLEKVTAEVMAVRPVRPPASTPAPDSRYVMRTGIVKSEPSVAAMESTQNTL